MDHVSQFLNLCRPGTRKLYSRALAVFGEFYESKGSIEDFWAVAEEDLSRRVKDRSHIALDVVSNYVEYLKGKNYSSKTIRSYLSALQSFFKMTEVPFSFKYVKGQPPESTQTEKFAWTLLDIARFSSLIESPMYKIILAVAVQSGLGISEILSLRWKDIKEEYEKGIIPLCLSFPFGRKKMQGQKKVIPFVTFIGVYAVNLLKTYLNGKQLQPDDRLFPVSSVAVNEYFARVGHAFLGPYPYRNPASPHSFRAFFRTALGTAKIDVDFIDYLMGHKVAEARASYVRKDKEQWRAIWKSVESYLTPSMENLVENSQVS